MKKHTLQEWADFLGEYVAVNPDGSIFAFEKEPKIYATFNSTDKRVAVEAYWTDYEVYKTPRRIPSYEIEDNMLLMNVGTDDNPRYYYVDWAKSLTYPKK